ncbi:hypothetical protein OG978_01265 [Streptomyces sp. NBC_01591]|uniref:hypothetical protein n=1 Tax=Streptomyces sp. NBC_01591 TaxID=2975888 RepID=UPI002DD932C3|nr:hypothetical protein [Streptomyces sp. NBC_01591]WSD66188.1 hypothetical protein OG978_01265 [Streptomyces sp. NBC_01591]
MSTALRPGDYLQIASERMAVDGVPDGEGYARIEQVELISDIGFLARGSAHMRTRAAREIAVVFCHGMLGPVMLREGDQWTLGEVDGDRARWDAAHPWWPEMHGPLFTGSRLATGPHPFRSTIEGPSLVKQAASCEPHPPRRRAAVFDKPAHTVMVGDYLQVHAVRHPKWDMRIDEGFHRVEWVGHLTGGALAGVLNNPAWARGHLTLVSVHGLSGILVLPEIPVPVLVRPNPERRRSDEDEAWHEGPFYELAGATEPDLAEQRRADAGLRPEPPASEAELYPSRFSSAAARALHLDGVTSIRPVAASHLPWPHGLFKCPLGERAKSLAATYPKGHSKTAHAELFTQLDGQDFAACPYHQADDWKAIAEAVLAFARAERDSDEQDRLYRAAHLSDRDRAWFRSLIGGGHIWWDTGQKNLTNGQHRLCALRAAGVEVIPVYGRHLPDQDETKPSEAAHAHARRTVEDFWDTHTAAALRPGVLSTQLARLLVRYPRLRVLLPKRE